MNIEKGNVEETNAEEGREERGENGQRLTKEESREEGLQRAYRRRIDKNQER